MWGSPRPTGSRAGQGEGYSVGGACSPTPPVRPCGETEAQQEPRPELTQQPGALPRCGQGDIWLSSTVSGDSHPVGLRTSCPQGPRAPQSILRALLALSPPSSGSRPHPQTRGDNPTLDHPSWGSPGRPVAAGPQGHRRSPRDPGAAPRMRSFPLVACSASLGTGDTCLPLPRALGQAGFLEEEAVSGELAWTVRRQPSAVSGP